MHSLFDLTGKTGLITGASGLLGKKHAEALLETGCSVIISDINSKSLYELEEKLVASYPKKVSAVTMDVTSKIDVCSVFEKYDIDILINNAAKDPKVTNDDESLTPATRFETMTEDFWHEGLDVMLNGTFLCSQAFCNSVIKRGKKGVIINMASDLAVISPDHRLYRKVGVEEDKQNVKPITYSAAKWAIVGMTKYLSVYFANKGIRVNCLSPAGVYNDHPDEFVQRISNVIPMGRMANIDECKGAIIFLASDASSYMTGANLIVDGGRTVW